MLSKRQCNRSAFAQYTPAAAGLLLLLQSSLLQVAQFLAPFNGQVSPLTAFYCQRPTFICSQLLRVAKYNGTDLVPVDLVIWLDQQGLYLLTLCFIC